MKTFVSQTTAARYLDTHHKIISRMPRNLGYQSSTLKNWLRDLQT